LIALDLIGLVKPDIDDIRRGIEDRLPISREAVIVSCSHNAPWFRIPSGYGEHFSPPFGPR
jgi:hypothetical protein